MADSKRRDRDDRRDRRRRFEPTTDNPVIVNRGLYQDSTPLSAPDGVHSFALNMAPGDLRGETSTRVSEIGNEIFSKIPAGFSPVGKVYIGDNETVLFLAPLRTDTSIIGIVKPNGDFEVVVEDSNSSKKDKLGFKTTHQIEAVYRVRGSCNKTIYFVQKDKSPRYFNFGNVDAFKNPDKTWRASLFALQKHYDKIPSLSEIKVLDNGGNLVPGSYNVSIQLVDSDLNPTEWITTSEVIKIYNDSVTDEYRDISGSINSESAALNYPNTSKAIRVEVSNLDTSYPYYRLAFIEATSGSGQVTSVNYTDVISTNKDFFTYNGDNFLTKGSESEIMMFTDIIESAETIVQIQNRLLLMNLKGKSSNLCALQKYASKITADCVTKKINLSSIQKDNPKNPTHSLEAVGYMPGEIYSFGIVYVFEDKTLSPVYHIPGKSPDVGSEFIFSEGDNTYGMSSDNAIETTYIPNSTNLKSFWGRDSEGVSLRSKPVRHHRFPLRSELGLPLVKNTKGEVTHLSHYQLELKISGILKTPRVCDVDEDDCEPIVKHPFQLKVSYKVGGQQYEFTQNIDPYQYESPTSTTYDLELSQLSPVHSSSGFAGIKIEISDINGEFYDLQYSSSKTEYDSSPYGDFFQGEFSINIGTRESQTEVQDINHETEILGINFSNIEIPSEEEIGEKVIGYYIVRNNRTEFDKTILDSGVLVPTIENDKYISQGLLQPSGDYKQNKSVYGLIHPEHKFKDRKYSDVTSIIQEGNFKVSDVKYGKVNYDDVYEGSSYNSDNFKGGNDDGHDATDEAYTRGYDGFSFNIISRDTIVDFENRKEFTLGREDIEDSFYLTALDSRSIDKGKKEVYNISADNRIGILNLKNKNLIPSTSNLPYVVMKKENLESYSDFRVLPYYKQNTNPVMFDDSSSSPSSVSVFSGDSYVSPVRYVNTMFWDNRIAERAPRGGKFAKIAGIFIAAAGILLSIVSGGTSLGLVAVGASIAAASAGLLLASSGIKKEKWSKAYGVEYDNGLRETVLDSWVKTFYNYDRFVGNYFPVAWGGQTQHSRHHAKSGPSDDTIQWIGDCVTDLWFETSINTAIRTRMVDDIPNFLGAPGPIESGQNSPIGLWEFFGKHYSDSNQVRYPVSSLERHLVDKLLEFSPERNDGKSYLGIPLGEYYDINPDYERLNSQKIHSHIPLEYNCTSGCSEEFPHRWRWSEQSFKEELSDNYRILLPNNYRDLEGDTGEITNAITFGEKLYIHTRESFFEVPKNHQERVTDQIVSFIGTGSLFEIPPRKLMDSNIGMSPGLQHKWGALKTPQGYFFPSENLKTIYQFTGENLIPISEFGLRKWFGNNLKVNLDREFVNSTGENYFLSNNPSNRFGTGFITVYDPDLKRVIFTKKDYSFADGIIDQEDFKIKYHNDRLVIFKRFQAVIDEEKSRGNTFVGFEDGKMKFSYEELQPKLIQRVQRIAPSFGESITYSKKYFATTVVEGGTGQEIGKVTYVHYPTGETRTTIIEKDICTEIVSTKIISTEHVYQGCQEDRVLTDLIATAGGTTFTQTVQVDRVVVKYKFIEGEILEDPLELDRSWTLSYSLENGQDNHWISWHSYMPNFYFQTPEGFFSWRYSSIRQVIETADRNRFGDLWKHNSGNKYGVFYRKKYPFILEFPMAGNPLQTRIWNHIKIHSLALRYDEEMLQSYEEGDITFNKAIIYNATQCSGVIELKPKHNMEGEEDFMRQQIVDQDNVAILERRERDWTLNNFRDIRVNYRAPIWRSDIDKIQDDYYIDKVLNEASLDVDKDWSELESFRGKYLMVRLIFDKFEDVQLSVDYLIENITSQEQ